VLRQPLLQLVGIALPLVQHQRRLLRRLLLVLRLLTSSVSRLSRSTATVPRSARAFRFSPGSPSSVPVLATSAVSQCNAVSAVSQCSAVQCRQCRSAVQRRQCRPPFSEIDGIRCGVVPSAVCSRSALFQYNTHILAGNILFLAANTANIAVLAAKNKIAAGFQRDERALQHVYSYLYSYSYMHSRSVERWSLGFVSLPPRLVLLSRASSRAVLFQKLVFPSVRTCASLQVMYARRRCLFGTHNNA
jgi:hypothetical protein